MCFGGFDMNGDGSIDRKEFADILNAAMQLHSESDFAICFPLEIPPRGFPFQMTFFV